MIREFAIEPELVVEWLSQPGPYLSVLRDGFGVGTPRIISRYPGASSPTADASEAADWKTLVRDLWQSKMKILESGADTDETKGRVQFVQTRGEALLQLLMLAMVDRSTLTWHGSKSWLVNALGHSPDPLENILARRADPTSLHVLHEDTFLESPQWRIETSRYVTRDALTLAGAIAPLLSRCMRVIFVDPYFGPDHMKSFREFLRAIEGRRDMKAPLRIDVHTTNKKGCSWSWFRTECERHIGPHVPPSWKVHLIWLQERDGGEELHNRYILSDLGGVTFGRGLDAGHATKGDDVSLMSRDHYDKRWAQHTSSPLAFDLDPEGGEPVLERKSAAKPTLRGPQAGKGPRR